MTTYTKSDLLRLLRDLISHKSPLKDIAVTFRAGVDPNGSVREGLRPLHYAVYENYLTCVAFLINQGADVNVADEIGYTPLHLACKHGHREIAFHLIEKGAVVDFTSKEDGGSGAGSDVSRALSDLTCNPLSLALENDHPECAELLLQNGAKANNSYFLGHEINMIPLENHRSLDVLLRHGADPDVFSRSGTTALMKACKTKKLEAVRTLIRNGASVNLQCPPRFDQKTALHFAALAGDPDVVRVLLEAGATTGKLPDYPHAPIEAAICGDKLDAVRVFLEFGANPNETNEDACSLLQTAVSAMGLSARYDIMEALLQHGADPNFHRATYSYIGPSLTPVVEYFTYQEEYDIAVLKLLLTYGARVNLTRTTKMLRLGDPCGMLGQIRKLRPYGEIFRFLMEAAGAFSLEAIQRESSLSNGQREILLDHASNPRDLKHLARIVIRGLVRLPIPANVRELPLPPFLKSYLLFQV